MSYWRESVNAIRHAVIIGVWIPYFMCSKRVKAYYGANATKLSL